VPNDVVQFVTRVVTVGNIARADPIPLRIPDKVALRVRYVEFRIEDLSNADRLLIMGLSLVAGERARTATTQFMEYNKYIAFWVTAWEATGAAGLMATDLSKRIDVWDMDYRLVIGPTFHALTTPTAAGITAVVAGELVRATEGERNAIIATQGGAK